MSSWPLLTLRQAGELLGCHHTTVRHMIARGELRGYRVGHRAAIRVAEADVLGSLRPIPTMTAVPR